MSWTKRELITAAFDELGMAGYVFDLTPDQLENARRKLDSMLATWYAANLTLGYLLPANQDDSDLDDQSNLPDYANEAVYLNLALRIAPSYGKQPSPVTVRAANNALSVVVRRLSRPVTERQMPSTTPRGAGNTRGGMAGANLCNPYVRKPVDSIETGLGKAITLNGGTLDDHN